MATGRMLLVAALGLSSCAVPGETPGPVESSGARPSAVTADEAVPGPDGTSTLSTAPPGIGPLARVVRLIDGDSGWFSVDRGGGSKEIEVRLLGYNAPERYEGDGGSLSCNGEAAGRALADLLDDAGRIEMVGEETDRYGRLLADLVVDGVSAVEQMVADGRGLAIGDDRPEHRDLMREAAVAGRGMWGGGCGSPTVDGLEVTAVEPDPPGRDEDDLNGEYVELVNRGSEPIDLAGWDIRDDSSSHRFDLDQAGTLGPGDRLVIRTGAGATTTGELYLDAGTPVWSNRADTVLVIDPDGVVAAWAFIG